jgi:hypothetical protein
MNFLLASLSGNAQHVGAGVNAPVPILQAHPRGLLKRKLKACIHSFTLGGPACGDKALTLDACLHFLEDNMKNTKAGKAPAHNETGLIVLSEIVNHYTDLRFEDAVLNLAGVADLIQHHPGYQDEVQAIHELLSARDVLCHLGLTVMLLGHTPKKPLVLTPKK